MSGEKEAFLDRWSRLKREQAEEKPAVVQEAEEEPAPPLQPVEDLKPDSDFTPFMNPKVDPATRRDALKKLFADAHYNVPDPFEAYSEDYTKSESIPRQMLQAINRVRDVALRGEEQVAAEEQLARQAQGETQAAATPDAEAPPQKPEHVPGKQDA